MPAGLSPTHRRVHQTLSSQGSPSARSRHRRHVARARRVPSKSTPASETVRAHRRRRRCGDGRCRSRVAAAVAALVTGLCRLEPMASSRAAAADHPLRLRAARGPAVSRPPSDRSSRSLPMDARSSTSTPSGVFLRSMGDLDARLIVPGTARQLDDRSSILLARRAVAGLLRRTGPGLKKVSVSGGASMTLCEIVDSDRGELGGGQHDRVWPARGHHARLGERRHAGARDSRPPTVNRCTAPSCCPTATLSCSASRPTRGPTRVESARRSWCNRSRRVSGSVVVHRGSDAHYLQTGHLLYAFGDVVLAMAFDPDRLTTTGGAVPVVQDVQRPVGVNAAALEPRGLRRGHAGLRHGDSIIAALLVWVNRDGATDPIPTIPPGATPTRVCLPMGTRIADA